MFIILVYDVNIKRTVRVMKLCREYFTHIQNSVFEGEITESSFKEFTIKLKKIIKKDTDSVIVFKLWSDKYYNKEILGKEKNDGSNFI